MRAGILQPGYLPWLGFFEQVARSDSFVLYDDVQYDKHGWRNRNRIKTANGVQWLTVPVLTTGKDKPLIRDVEIDNIYNWRRKHLTAIQANYAKAEFFSDVFGFFDSIYRKEWKLLVDLDIALILGILDMLGLPTSLRLSSELNIVGDRVSRLISICKVLGADVFYEGKSGENYIDEETFLAAGIRVEYQNYLHPAYKQLYGGFVPYLSIVDLLFNEGPRSLDILMNGGKKSWEAEA